MSIIFHSIFCLRFKKKEKKNAFHALIYRLCKTLRLKCNMGFIVSGRLTEADVSTSVSVSVFFRCSSPLSVVTIITKHLFGIYFLFHTYYRCVNVCMYLSQIRFFFFILPTFIIAASSLESQEIKIGMTGLVQSLVQNCSHNLVNFIRPNSAR